MRKHVLYHFKNQNCHLTLIKKLNRRLWKKLLADELCGYQNQKECRIKLVYAYYKVSKLKKMGNNLGETYQ